MICNFETGFNNSKNPNLVKGLITVTDDFEDAIVTEVNGEKLRVIAFHALHGKKPGETRMFKNLWSLSAVGKSKTPYVRWFDDIGDVMQWLNVYEHSDMSLDDFNLQFEKAR